ncbi:MAG: tripartite tricarboxylate transporter substrate binding protein [Burkholderiales bacterium]|nr:tripartite tricarboxylate transporter substrate binding protein [Burkholderiales bacterium]
MKPLATVLLVAATWPALVHAQAYPARSVRIIVPSSAGGGIDVTTRALTPRLSESLRQPVLVENRPGAETMIGTEMVAKAPPDGYTLLSVFDNFPLTQHMIKKVPYDALRDFAPVALLVRGPMIVGVPPQLGVKDLAEFVNLARAKGGAFNYGSAGVGTSSHLSVELFKLRTGTDLKAVHYKGAAPAVTDLIGGHIQLMIAASGTLIPQVRGGKLLALAVTAPERIPQLPGVRAVAETYPGFDAFSWVGMLAPAGTPAEIVRRLNAEVTRILVEPEVKSGFEKRGWEVAGGSPEDFGRWLAAQTEKWVRVIRERNITLD